MVYIVDRSLKFLRGAVLSFGPEAIKRRIWDKEYRSEKWKFAYNTSGDCVYGHLERYARGGSILDMGCGSGNTSTEMAESAYTCYVGVDIAEAALEKARRRSAECGREAKNSYACSDFFSYEPTGQFDVILFRESMYHVPMGKIKPLLEKLAPHLKTDGVFIVRLFTQTLDTGERKERPNTMLRIMESEFDLLEKRQYEVAGRPVVLVFRPVAKGSRREQTEPSHQAV